MGTTRPRLLLTGASGMVGRNLLDHPAAARWDILRPTSSELNLTDADTTQAYMAHHRPDAVIHAAGRVGGIQANIAAPVAFLDDNLLMGRNIIVAARAAGVPRLLNLASTCMYPKAAENPLREELVLTGALEPTNEGYALAKIMAARLCQYIRQEDPNAQYKTLIPCNLYGLYDKFDPRTSHLVPAILHKMHEAYQAQADSVEIWGDGTARREFLFAGDLAEAMFRALDDLESLPDMMNIGVGSDCSVNDYYAAAAEVVGWSGRFEHDLSKPVGMKQKLCDTSRQTAWGWAPKVSLAEGLDRVYAHYKEVVSV